MTRYSFSALIAVVLIFSCSSGDKQLVRNTIIRYNELLSRGYAEMNMTGLRELATENQIEKVYIHMAALGEGKVKMISELKNIDIEDISFPSKDAAMVLTKETWNYTHVNIDTNKVDKKVEGIVYKLSYDLVKSNGRWVVANVVSRDE